MNRTEHLTTSTTDFPMPIVAPSGPEASCTAAQTAAHVDRQLSRLEELIELLVQEGYAMPAVDFDLPAEFKLSVVVPVFNEQTTIYPLLSRVAMLPLPKEIVVVDDRSTDQTPHLLQALQSAGDLKILFKPVNEGKGAALRDGLAMTTGDIVVIQDADLEYDPRDIPPLLKPILNGEADVVYGSRFLGEDPQDPSALHRWGNRLLTGMSNLLTGLELTDMETCYKAFRGDVIRQLPLRQNRFGFEPEVTARLARRGYRIVELPISYRARSYEEGKKIGIKDGFNALYCMLRYAAWE